MRILVLSDLHDDFWAATQRDPFEGIEPLIAGLDHLILAGDVSNKPKVRWKHAFQRILRLVPPERVSVFPGNHDFYDFCIDDEDRLRQIAASFGVGYVQKAQIHIGPARFLCATLWTDLELGRGRVINGRVAAERMNDFRAIRVASGGYRKLRPSDVVTQHHDHLAWLTEALGQPFDGDTYVVTHHAPHPDVLTERSEGLDAAFASDLREVIATYRPKAWLFGHSHSAIDLTVGATALRNVSLGYPDEVADPGARIRKLIFEV